MIEKCYYIKSSSINPYYNLALEDYLFHNIPANSLVFFLCQNQNTVMIGKNQNAWKECDVQRLEADGGHLARRLSGGGAVYHDLGNLNFTFCTSREDYDVSQQTDVILRAVQRLGIGAVRNGRNDLTADGRKFSGHAFLKKESHCYHHGTLMVDVDGGELAKYLRPDPQKLAGKGVDSVRSRVVNLRELAPDLTIDRLAEALTESLAAVYGLPVKEVSEADLHAQEEAAREIGVHEATVYRAIQGKHLYCARGTFPLSHFFQKEISGGVSAAHVKEIIRGICRDHEKLSDRAIAEELKKRGITLSRRTVAKYRSQMEIDSSFRRSTNKKE